MTGCRVGSVVDCGCSTSPEPAGDHEPSDSEMTVDATNNTPSTLSTQRVASTSPEPVGDHETSNSEMTVNAINEDILNDRRSPAAATYASSTIERDGTEIDRNHQTTL